MKIGIDVGGTNTDAVLMDGFAVESPKSSASNQFNRPRQLRHPRKRYTKSLCSGSLPSNG